MRFPTLYAAVKAVCGIAVCAAPAIAAAQVTEREIDDTIQKGVNFLVNDESQTRPRSPELLAYTLVRAKVAKDHPIVVNALKGIQESIQTNKYSPFRDGYYQAGLAAMLLEAVDPKLYRPELEAVANYLLEGQRLRGYWDYPGQDRGGDTSITQYALLGLWSATHAGIEVPPSVWDKAAEWLLRNQQGGGVSSIRGGFTYHPTEAKTVTHSMTAAGTSSLMLCRRQLFPGQTGAPPEKQKEEPDVKEEKPTKLYGILKLVDITGENERTESPEVRSVESAKLKLSDLNAGVKGGVGWFESNYAIDLKRLPVQNSKQWNYYYLYGLERVGSFGELETIASHDWYDDGARFLMATQFSDGHWKGSEDERVTTCLSILFLVKATAQALGQPPPQRRRDPKVGTGLLAGGRGLPDDLKKVQMKNGRVQTLADEKEVTDLLSQLEAGAAAELTPEERDKELEKLEQAVVETVRSGQRDSLIGQVDRLKKLVSSPSAEARRIALWALARSNDLTLAPIFIERLSDADLDVAIEANQGLCILSRKLKGVGVPADPLADLRNQQPEDKLAEIGNRWRKQAADGWKAWYLSIRPYSERDDLLDHVTGK